LRHYNPKARRLHNAPGRRPMIYTVELNFSESARAAEWNAWYET
jgi:hypothetical protein